MATQGQFEPIQQGTQSGSSIPDSSRKSAGQRTAGMCHYRKFMMLVVGAVYCIKTAI